MTLTDAYERLQWDAPLSYERTMFGSGLSPSFPRGIGTSVHMLIELYLDMCRSQGSLVGRAQFLVQCLSPEQGRELRDWLLKIHQALDLDVDLGYVRFAPFGRSMERLRGEVWHSWAIFCDHAVKEDGLSKTDRNVGPYGLIRRLEPAEPIEPSIRSFWRAYDRDGHFMVALTENGKNDLMDTATCPITLSGARPTTYPAGPTLGSRIPVRLRKAFER